MKIFFVGDFYSDNGPANVNKSYKKYFDNKKNITYSLMKNKILRLLELIYKIIISDRILFSGLSKQNILGIKIAHFCGKETFYLMHGYYKIESKIEENTNLTNQKLEEKIIEEVDCIICVSEKFAKFLKKELPKHKSKIKFVNNGIMLEKKIKSKETKKKVDEYNIVSIGGGMKRKNNLSVCKAINQITNMKIKFIVIGGRSSDGKEIEKYEFVEFYESLKHEQVLEILQKTDLYIQNSYFETFGLGVVEAVQAGCKILVSKNIGSVSIIQNTCNDNIIYNVDDYQEIKNKIIKLLKEKKASQCYITSQSSWEESGKKLLKIIEERDK